MSTVTIRAHRALVQARRPASLLQTECIELFFSGCENVLMPVEHVGDAGIAWIRDEAGVPQRLAGTRIEGDEVSGAVTAEEEIADDRRKGWASTVEGS
jgi:hypothetical protein